MLLIGSPTCSAFSQLQNLNFNKMNPEEVQKVIAHGTRHLEFCLELYFLHFLHEHPATARSWQLRQVQEIVYHPGIHTVIGDMCTWSMMQQDSKGMGYIKEPTRFMTNSECIARRLSQRCPGNHRHIQLVGGQSQGSRGVPRCTMQDCNKRTDGTNEVRWKN